MVDPEFLAGAVATLSLQRQNHKPHGGNWVSGAAAKTDAVKNWVLKALSRVCGQFLMDKCGGSKFDPPVYRRE
jgi:hypothetical protein